MELQLWLAFFAASWAISLSPGPGALAAMSSGLAQGFRRGYWTTAGLVLGVWTQTLVVGAGLGALIATSGTAFTVLKWAGAAYLVGLGVQQWRAGAAPVLPAGPAAAPSGPARRRDLVLRGWMVNAVNPKGTVFIMAVVPQFIVPTQPLVPQYLVIAATLGFTDLVVMAGYTGLAARVLGLLRAPRQVRWLNRSFGALFVAAGALLATVRRA